MNLALHDVRRRAGAFVATAFGLALLMTVVLAMAGIYQGLVEDALVLSRAMRADVWVVQHGTRGPFADASRLDPSVEARVAAVPGVATARAYLYQPVQRDHGGRALRIALVGLSWPDDRGDGLRLVAGRGLRQSRGEIVADASLALRVGEVMRLAGEDYRVVGVTRNVLASGGEGAAFVSIADLQDVLQDAPAAAVAGERQRRLARLRATDLGRSQPALEDLAVDPRWRLPGLARPPIHAVLVRLESPRRLAEVRRALDSWGDVATFTQGEEESLLLQGLVQKARLQLGMFSAILVLTSSVVIALVLYNMTLQKTHDLAVLKLMGAPFPRLALMVLQQAWMLGAIGLAMAVAIGQVAFAHFPRRVIITPTILWGAGALVLVVTTAASLAGVAYVARVDAGRVLDA